MRNTANILSFDDARVSRRREPSRRSSSRPASQQPTARSSRATVRRDARRSSGESDDASNESEKQSVIARSVAKAKAWKRARTKSRADKAFDRQFQSRPSDASQSGPRAALYKGEMGATQKRAARMQNGSSGGARAAFAGAGGSAAGAASGIVHSIASSRRLTRTFIVAVCLVLACIMLYEPAQLYYHAVREQAQAQAELAAVESRNADLESAVAHLETDAGVEQAARDQLGWVLPGENSVYVQGLEGTTEQSASSTAGSIVPGSVEAPDTWYSPILDVIFGAE